MPATPSAVWPRGRSISPAAVAFLVLLAGAAVPGRVAAQKPPKRVLIGRVTDQATGQPLLGASVSLGVSRRTAVTDTAGRFILHDVPDGPQVLVADQLGYAAAFVPVEVGEATGMVLISLEPDPIVLQGVTVLADRFRRRRNAVATSVRVFDRDKLLSSGAYDAKEFVLWRAGLFRTSCNTGAFGRAAGSGFLASGFAPAPPAFTNDFDCIYVRGRPVSPSVYIDERPAFGGLDELSGYPASQLYLVEVYGGGAQIRVYSTWFVEHSAKRGLMPIPFF
ncbi:MAG TPA: carboxypeptidase-like regulatory domain-containing protein [Longimicrobiales bacterium]|nr:carboxypeptidase-like regulatory domain-containing protein [Longimicrobiales bacterium]